MSSTPSLSSVQVGDVIAEYDVHFTRDVLVRYAGASGDFNPIHYRDDIAKSVGLEGVLAHGMLTMGVVASGTVEWLGDAGFVCDYQVRFTKPVFVDADQGADVHVVSTIAAIDAQEQTARIDIKALFREQTVLAKSQLVVKFW